MATLSVVHIYVLKLMRHSDSVRIVHLYKKPLVGDYDEQPFAHCHAFLDTANLNGVVEIVALEPGTTVAESLHEYIAKHNVSYLVLGLNGTGLTDNTCADKREPGDEGDEMLENPVGRVTAAMLFSPRCTLCICP